MDLISNEKTFLFIEYILSSLRLAFCILNNAETPSTYENVLVRYKGKTIFYYNSFLNVFKFTRAFQMVQHIKLLKHSYIIFI